MSGGNYLAYNLGVNPAVNFNFMLRVEGVLDLPCRSVRAFQKENEYEYIQEGGLNDYVHMRRKPISKPFTIQVERYVGVDMLDPLANGTELVLPLILYVNRYSIYGEFHPVRMYVFSGCTVTAKEYGELNAEQSGLLLETTTIAYREMYTVENIATSFVTEDTWKFNERTKEGNGNRKANTVEKYNISEERKPAKKWIFKNGNTYNEAFNGQEMQEATELDFLGMGMSSKSASLSKEDKENRGKQAKGKKWKFKSPSSNQPPLDQSETAEPDFLGTDMSSKSAQTSKISEDRKEEWKAKSKKYSFKEDKNKNKQAKVEEGELSKEELEAKSKKYSFKNDKNKNKQAKVEEKEASKEELEDKSKKYSFKNDKINNKQAKINKNELRKDSMDNKGKKYDMVMNSGKSAVTSDKSSEKQLWEKKAKKWPKASSAMTVEMFMSNAKLGK